MKPFIVVKSSAGSGKTYTLVRSFLKMVFKSDEPKYFRHILAITFTNKATNEMKVRILDALDGIAGKKDKYVDLTKDLSGELNISSSDLVVKAERILSQIMHEYTDFNISTIDRFVYKLIRSFSFELNIPRSIEIELNRDRILHKSIDALFDHMNSNTDLANLLIEFSEHKFSNDKSFNIEKDLFEMAKEVINTRTEPFLEELDKVTIKSFYETKEKIKKSVDLIEKTLKQKANLLSVKIHGLGLTSDDLAKGKNGIYGYLNSYTGRKVVVKPPWKSVISLQENGEWKSSKISKENAGIIESEQGELNTLLNNFLDYQNSIWNTYHFAKIMWGRIHSMALVSTIHKEIGRYKEENDIAQLDDFNTLIEKLIDENPVPYIFERSGEKYHHFLIDEFQDTSKIQWYNMLPLIENSLSEGKETLLVGDSKQAIYRWRGGDAGQLSRLPALKFENKSETELAFREEMLTSMHEGKELNDNHRSSVSVVEFVNEFFDKIKEHFVQETEGIFDNHRQHVKKSEITGSVDIRFLDKDASFDERLEEIREAMLRYKNLGYSYGDVAILCRKKDQCSSVADFLINEKIPVISSESLKLSQSREVNFLLNWIRYFVDSGKSDISYSLLQYLTDKNKLGGLSNDELVKLWKEKESFEKIIHHAIPEFDLASLRLNSLQELCTEIAHCFLDDQITDPFVLNFIDHVARFQNKMGNDFIEFLSWWDENGIDLNVEMPEKLNSVRIMTIHKAKGLEFDVVLLPFMYDTIKAGESHFWVHTEGEDANLMPLAWLPATKSLLESRYSQLYEEEMDRSFIDSLNLMYVAITRAAHHLTILSENNPKKDNKYKEENLLWRCFDLNKFNGSSEEGTFFTGKFESYITSSDVRDDGFTYGNLENINWRQRIQLKYRVDNKVISDQVLSAQEFGNLIHEILSEVEVLEDLNPILSQYVIRGLITQPQADLLQTSIRKTISDSPVSEYFIKEGNLVFNERDLLSAQGLVLRPDRLVFCENKAVLIDYKTGKPDESHENQMNQYKSVLNDLGDWLIESYLVYFSSGEVKRVA